MIARNRTFVGQSLRSSGRQSTVNVFPAHLQSQPHQMRPVWTARQILGSFLRRSIMTRATSDERTALDPILAWPLAAHA